MKEHEAAFALPSGRQGVDGIRLLLPSNGVAGGLERALKTYPNIEIIG